MAVPTPNNNSALPSVRTFAKDLAKKRALSEEVATEVTPAAKIPLTKPTISIKKTETQTYRAPSWTANKTPEVTTEKTKETLTPIAAVRKEHETIVVKTEETKPGIILKEGKKDRFRLFPAIFASIRGWFNEQKQKQEAKKTPMYTVPDTSRRKGVIQKATSKTGKITSSDHLSIHERIRQRKERAVPKAPTTIWTANTEPGFLLLEAPEPVISNIKVIQKKSFRTEGIKTLPKKETEAPLPVVRPVTLAEAVVETTLPVSEPEPVIASTIQVNPTVTENLPVEPVVNVAVVQNYSDESEVTINTHVDDTETVTRLKPANLREWLFSINTNTISIGIAGLCFALLLGTGITYLWYTDKAEPVVTVAVAEPILSGVALSYIYTDDLTATSLYQNVLANIPQNQDDISQIIFSNNEASTVPLPPEIILASLNVSLDSSFIQSINTIYFGSTGKKNPFIILTVSDLNTAKGGMLAWENSLYGETENLFNHNFENEPGAIKTAIFTDSVLEETDVRIFKTLAGAELLVYGIANRETIIITTNTETFTKLMTLIK